MQRGDRARHVGGQAGGLREQDRRTVVNGHWSGAQSIRVILAARNVDRVGTAGVCLLGDQVRVGVAVGTGDAVDGDLAEAAGDRRRGRARAPDLLDRVRVGTRGNTTQGEGERTVRSLHRREGRGRSIEVEHRLQS